MKPWLVLVLSLLWSLVPFAISKPETQKSKKKSQLNQIIQTTCRGDLHEAYRMTDHVSQSCLLL
jgi:hypothetical protein